MASVPAAAAERKPAVHEKMLESINGAAREWAKRRANNTAFGVTQEQFMSSRLKREWLKNASEKIAELEVLGQPRQLTTADVTSKVPVNVDDPASVGGGISCPGGVSLENNGISAGTRNILLARILKEDDVKAMRVSVLQACKSAGVTDVSFVHAAAEDPGERTAWTVYDWWNGVVWYLGHGWTNAEHRNIMRPKDKLQSKRDKLAATKNASDTDLKAIDWKMKRLGLQHERNRDKLHRTVARLYGALFRTVFRPTFRTGPMMVKHRSISPEVTRRMGSIGHYAFGKRLGLIAKHKGMKIHRVNESYTSKLCGSCAHYHRHLGRSKVFVCPKCRKEEERGN